MAEARDMIAKTNRSEIIHGHVHHEKSMSVSVDTNVTMKMRFQPALCATDAYHYNNGWIGEPGANLLIYNEDGLEMDRPLKFK